MQFKYGLKPVTELPKLKLVNYLAPNLPKPPLTFGHGRLIAPMMLGNDQVGDCAIAGSIEEIRLLNAERGVTVPFTTATALRNYSDITGYDPRNPDTDQGTDMADLYRYRQHVGIIDDAGQRHTLSAYVGLTPGNWDELVQALYLFQVAGIGIQCPDYLQEQFAHGGPWTPLRGRHDIVGGHYIPAVARSGNSIDILTWGRSIKMTKAFYQRFSNVAVVHFTDEMLNVNGKTIDGVDRAALLADLNALGRGTVA